MPTDQEIALIRARQAWWLKMCRETDPRKPTLGAVAKAAGLDEGSGSVVSLWENNRTKSGPKYEQLVRLAAYYAVPLSVFTEPPETDQERLAHFRQLALGAIAVGQQDAAAEPASGRGADDPPGDMRRRRSA